MGDRFHKRNALKEEKNVCFDPKRHYSNCQMVYFLANELQKPKRLDRTDDKFIEFSDYVMEVGQGCANVVRTREFMSNEGDNKEATRSRYHTPKERDEKKRLCSNDAYAESLKTYFMYTSYASIIGRWLDEMNSANKMNVLHSIKRVTNEVRNPWVLEGETDHD